MDPLLKQHLSQPIISLRTRELHDTILYGDDSVEKKAAKIFSLIAEGADPTIGNHWGESAFHNALDSYPHNKRAVFRLSDHVIKEDSPLLRVLRSYPSEYSPFHLEFFRVAGVLKIDAITMSEAAIKKSHEAIIRGAEGLSGTAFVVVCDYYNDIPFASLAEQFSEVLVVNTGGKRAKTMILKKIATSLHHKFEFLRVDVTGFQANILQELRHTLDNPKKTQQQKKTLIQDIIFILERYIEISPKAIRDGLKPPSYIVSSMLLTRLFSPVIHYVNCLLDKHYDETGRDEYNKYEYISDRDIYNEHLERTLSELELHIEKCYLRAMRDFVAPGGKVCLSYETAYKDVNKEGTTEIFPAVEEEALEEEINALFHVERRETCPFGATIDSFDIYKANIFLLYPR
ncbi:MAG: hypothetical protein HN980_04090 [Waddliaceae bacterium]|nr:hypothetical protein [Waddliaceae bacterium]